MPLIAPTTDGLPWKIVSSSTQTSNAVQVVRLVLITATPASTLAK